MRLIKIIFNSIIKIIDYLHNTIKNILKMFLSERNTNKIHQKDNQHNANHYDDDLKETERYIESIMNKKIDDMTLEEIDAILEYNKSTLYINENYIKKGSGIKNKQNTKQTKENTVILLKTGVIELSNKINNSIHPCAPTVMNTNGIITLLSIEDGTRHGIIVQLSIPEIKGKIKIAPNHIAAMDNVTTWDKYNSNLSVDHKVDKKKQFSIMSQINLNNDIDETTEVFFAMSNSKDGLIGITTKITNIYKMKTATKPIIVAISITVPKVEITGAISGCPLITGQSIFIANAARETEDLYQIFAVSLDVDIPNIMYKNSTTLQSSEKVKTLNRVNALLFKSTNMVITDVINLSSYPSGLILNYLTTETNWKINDKTQIRPLLPTLKIINNYIELQIFARKMILVVIDYDDPKSNKKLSWIMQINRNIYRVQLIDLSNQKINDFTDPEMNEYNTISYHVEEKLTKKQNFTNVMGIPNESYVSVYADKHGLATYSGLVKILQQKGCKTRIVRATFGKNLKIGWPIRKRAIINKNIAEDSLVSGETNWRYKACFLEYVDTPLGPYKLVEEEHGGKPQTKFTLEYEKQKRKKKIYKKLPIFSIIKILTKVVVGFLKHITKIAYYIASKIQKIKR